MNQQEIQVLLANGEDSLTRFKSPMDNPDQLAAELVAFSNSAGGRLFIGLHDDGSIAGLSIQDVQRLNTMLSTLLPNMCILPLLLFLKMFIRIQVLS